MPIVLFVTGSEFDVPGLSKELTTASVDNIEDVVKFLEPLSSFQHFVRSPEERYYDIGIKKTGLSEPFLDYLSGVGYRLIGIDVAIKGGSTIHSDEASNVIRGMAPISKGSAANKGTANYSDPIKEQQASKQTAKPGYTPPKGVLEAKSGIDVRDANVNQTGDLGAANLFTQAYEMVSEPDNDVDEAST
jgi:hypothetical protein